MASMKEVKCKCCGNRFMARTADIARGWGRFCSKNCKATRQTQKTGVGQGGQMLMGNRYGNSGGLDDGFYDPYKSE